MNLSIKLVVLRSKKRLVRVKEKESEGQGKRIEEQKHRDGVKKMERKKLARYMCSYHRRMVFR